MNSLRRVLQPTAKRMTFKELISELRDTHEPDVLLIEHIMKPVMDTPTIVGSNTRAKARLAPMHAGQQVRITADVDQGLPGRNLRSRHHAVH